MTIYRYHYIPSKPVTFQSLGDIRWKYLEAPPALAENMAGCPVSKHEHGVMLDAAGLTPVKSA
jgi:hypothetical protein